MRGPIITLTRYADSINQSPPPVLVANIRATILRSLIRTAPTEVIRFLYQNAKESLVLYRSRSDLRRRTEHLASWSVDAESQIQRTEKTLWLRGFDPIPCGITSGIIL